MPGPNGEPSGMSAGAWAVTRALQHGHVQVSGMKQSSGAEIPSNLDQVQVFIPRRTSHSQN
jgi:hypothetical protein